MPDFAQPAKAEPKPPSDDGFGNFGNFSEPPPVVQPTPAQKEPSDDGFGDFGNFNDTPAKTSPKQDDDAFGNFSHFDEAPAAAKPTGQPPLGAQATIDFNDDPFADLMGETKPPPAQPEVEVPTQKTEPIVQNVVHQTEEVDNIGFGNFTDFDQDVQKLTPKKASGDDDGFGDFGDFKDGPTADKKEAPIDEFD